MVKISVDSSSDIEQSDADKLGVALIPMQIRFGADDYSDGVDLSHRAFFEKLVESSELPHTSQINEYRFTEHFEKLIENGDEVIAISLSSKLSGTYACAVKAAEKFGGKVFVVDSLNASLGERILIDYALRLVKEGLSATEIVKELNEKKRKIRLLAVLDTLKYLRKGGRISSVAAIAGELLSIKPVISIVNGEVKSIGKALGSKNGNNLLNKLVEKCGVDFDMPIALAYSGISDAYLRKYLKDSEHLWKGATDFIPAYMIGSTIGTHVGPGAIAVSFFAK